jgi:hypothetical protein
LNQRGYTVDILGKNTETFLSFTVSNRDVCIEFKDTMQFMKNSLANLVNLLPDVDFIRRACGYDEKKLECVKRKQHFPYEWLSSYDKLSGSLVPPIETFYNELTNSQISQQEYDQLLDTLKTWGMEMGRNTFLDYLSFYNQSDVIFCAAITIEFCKQIIAKYDVNPLNCISLSGISENACMIATGARLELLSDIDHYRLFQQACSGGICQSGVRYVEANNPSIPETYDPTKETTHVVQLDACSLYGWSMMCNKHGTGNFKELSAEQCAKANIRDFDELSDQGQLWVVDLNIPEDQHDFLSLLPPAPKLMEITPEMLSKYTRELMDLCKYKLGRPKRLICGLYNLEKYVIHAQLLKLYVILLKLEIVKVHRIITYDQSYWLSEFINLNATYRKQAKSKHESDTYKNVSNSTFGRFLMRTDRFREFKITCNRDEFIKFCNNPRFKNSLKLQDDLILAEFSLRKSYYNRPVFVASSILAASKVKMYQFLYGTLCATIGRDNMWFNYMDTDSLTVKIKCENLNNFLLSIKDDLDTSNFPPSHPLFSLHNKKVPGKFVLEMGANIIKYSCVLSSKVYAISVVSSNNDEDAKQILKCRGFPQRALQEQATPENYKAALTNVRDMFKQFTFNNIISKDCQLFTTRSKRTALMCHYIKGVVLSNAIDTLPFGHKDCGKHC